MSLALKTNIFVYFCVSLSERCGNGVYAIDNRIPLMTG